MKPIKVQETVSLERVPSWALQKVRGEVMEKMQKACGELEHLVKQHSNELNVDPRALAFHIDQARRRLYDVDLMLQDIYAIAEGYIAHTTQTEEVVSNSQREARSELENAFVQMKKEVSGDEPEAKSAKRKSK